MMLPARLFGWAILLFARVLTGVQARWSAGPPDGTVCVYYANHTSHGDFVLVWGALPPWLRRTTRPVAGADYWQKSALRRFIGRDVFRALLIDRSNASHEHAGIDPVAKMAEAVAHGESLIVFPEGTRNTTQERLLPFKSGIFHLARLAPEVGFVPVWIENLNRVMPKGESIPVPVLCTVTFGAPLRLGPDEDKHTFVDRCRQALLALAPRAE